MTVELGDVVLRGMVSSDVAKVFSDWLKSQHDEPGYRSIPAATFNHWHHQLIESLMVDPTVAWIVACPTDRPTLILGWAAAQAMPDKTLVAHYLYVAKTFRRLGLGSRLLATLGLPRDTGLVTTAATKAGKMLLESRGNQALYVPYLLWGRAPIPTPPVERRKDFEAAMKRSRKANRTGHVTKGAT